jgi:putative transposase
MSSSRSSAIRLLRLRVKDKHAAWLCGLAREVNTGSILDRSVPSLGIDLGLRTFAAFSDEAIPPIEAERFYRGEPALVRAQRARHRHRSRAIHAKIANRRKDFLHQLSTRLVKAKGALIVGNVNASALAKTRQAKSVLDAGWSAFRTMLSYKCAVCGAIHDRNVNAAHNILAAGHRRLAEGILGL